MFSSSRLLLALGTTTLLRSTPRSTGTVRRKKDTPSFTAATESFTVPEASPDQSQSPPHVDVFSSVKESLDHLLGENPTKPANSKNCTNSRNSNKTSDANLHVPSYYRPMDLRGRLYDLEFAEPLCRAAAGRWRSPVWATHAAFARAGHKVRGDETGVCIPTSMQEVQLYNLEQTDAPEGIISRSLAGGEMAVAKRGVPLNPTGNPCSMWVRRILEKHPSFRQYTSPYWATEEEVKMLGTKVKRSQEGCGILIQRFSPTSSENAATSSLSSSLAEVDERETQSEMASKKEGSAGMASSSSNVFFMLYNAEQLEDPEMMSNKTCPPLECLNINGRRYSIAVTICMRQYCEKYNLRTKPFAVFVTPARVRALGGDLLPRENAVPPFTCVLRDELVTVYHADQTTISEQLNSLALSHRRERIDQIPVTVV
ncbi:hypothetical protein LSM04_005465 [Trypanosoma melophagium]|uniref:uncharacterized protein n=1 Tax=Trypanosoma melophagium TaxID=715481 RepID=UPI00351A951B|nr:hypothetical protein LSM04_005465 [Trypanosoma melophagium]